MKQKKVLTLLSAAAILTASFYMINKSDLYASNEELKMQGQSYSDKSGLFLSMDKMEIFNILRRKRRCCGEYKNA